MKNRVLSALALTLAATFGASSASAGILNYAFDWSGNGGYSMTGGFSFDDTLSSQTLVTASDLLTFTATIAGPGSPSGCGTDPDCLNGIITIDQLINFNFNAVDETLRVGGTNTGNDGQLWNSDGPGWGFQSGGKKQFITSLKNETKIDTGEITAARVPVPGTLALLGLGLLATRRLSR